MTETEALNLSTKWSDGYRGYYGYLPFTAANFLVGTGKYVFAQAAPWGYVVQLKTEANKED